MTEADLWIFIFKYVYAPFVTAILLLIKVYWVFRKNDVAGVEKMASSLEKQIEEEKDEISKILDLKLSQVTDIISQQSTVLADINDKLTNERLATAKVEQRLDGIDRIIDRRGLDRD